MKELEEVLIWCVPEADHCVPGMSRHFAAFFHLPVERASVIQLHSQSQWVIRSHRYIAAAAWCVTSTRHGSRFMVTWTFECKQDVQQGSMDLTFVAGFLFYVGKESLPPT